MPLLFNRCFGIDFGMKEISQPPSQQTSPRLLLQRTWLLPEPQLVSQPPSVFPLRAHTMSQPLLNGRPGWDSSHQQPVWHSPNVLHISQPPTQPTPLLPLLSWPSLMGAPTPVFSPPFHPHYHSQPLSLLPLTQEIPLAVPLQLMFLVASSPQPLALSQPLPYTHNPHFPSSSQSQYSQDS